MTPTLHETTVWCVPTHQLNALLQSKGGGPWGQCVVLHPKKRSGVIKITCTSLLYEVLVCNVNFKLSKYQKKNILLWVTLKLTDHIKRFHPSLNSGKLYMAKHSINAGKRMSTMFTNGVGRNENSPQFENYGANPINTCKINMAAWYIYGNQWVSKRTFKDKWFCNIME